MQKLYPLALLASTLLSIPAFADIEFSDTLSGYGDVRTGYYSQHRADRDGDHEDSDSWRLRVRAGIKVKLNEHWSGAVRAAGRYADEEGNQSFSIDRYATSPGGLEFGESTLDEAYVRYQGSPRWSLTVGRFQSKFVLDGVAVKSLDRNDSPSTDITWTDGIHWNQQLAGGWRSHLIVEYNSSEGPSNSKQEPLAFDEDRSRWSAFASFENKEPWGPVIHRALDITYLPEALYPRGLQDSKTENYYAFVARGVAKWPVGNTGSSFLLGMELGYAPNTPDDLTVRTGTSGDSSGTAYQVSFNWMDFAPGHSVGVVLGRADAGWLISPDFRPNGELAEIRYAWKPHKQHKVEVRLRERNDREQINNFDRDRVDTDYYVRYTYQF